MAGKTTSPPQLCFRANRCGMAYSLEVDAMVRGYHEYQEIWDAPVGEELQCQRETRNLHDIYAVAVLLVSQVCETTVLLHVQHLNYGCGQFCP